LLTAAPGVRRKHAALAPPAPERAAAPAQQPATASSRPTLRANPFPEVTDLFCRLPLSTLFYQLEAVNLGDLLRL